MKSKKIKHIGFLGLLIAYTIYSNDRIESGSLCVGPIPEPNDKELSLANPAGGGRDFNFSIQIDKGEIKKIPFNTNIQFTNLDLNKKHLITIRNNDKITESFWFNFSKYKSNKLCLWFKPLYESWSIWKQSDSKHLCKCK